MPEANIWRFLLTAVAYLAAGGMLFVFTVNRLLSRMRSSQKKLIAMQALLLSFTIFPIGLGWWLAGQGSIPAWLRWLFPAAVILLWVLGDIRMFWQRRRLQGSPPVSTEPTPPAGLAFLLHPLTTCDLVTVQYRLAWPGPELRLVHLSDLHLNHALPMDYYQQVIDRANQLKPDLVLLSGDFISSSDDIPLIPGLLEQLQTTNRVTADGIFPGKAIFASLGNHDYWSDPERVRKVLSAAGVSLLQPGPVRASKDHTSFFVCADDRPWGEGFELPSSQLPIRTGLVLSHSPDNIYDLAKLPGFWAVFSGHVHAGQFRFPFPWGSASIIVPSKYGRRLDHGHFAFTAQAACPEQATHLFVNAGIGAAEPPVRLYCPPEILVLDFQHTNPLPG